MSLMTNEDREYFLPVVQTLIKILKKEDVDENEIQMLLDRSTELTNFFQLFPHLTDFLPFL